MFENSMFIEEESFNKRKYKKNIKNRQEAENLIK